MPQRLAGSTQQLSHLWAAIQVSAMVTPSGDHLIGPSAALLDDDIIFGADGGFGCSHVARISVAPCEYICDAKPTKAQGPCPALATLNGGIILHLGGCGWVEHDKGNLGACGVPNAGERIAIQLAIRIDCNAGRIALGVESGNHGLW